MNVRAPISAFLALGITGCFGGDSPSQDSVETLSAADDWQAGGSRQHMHAHAEQLEALSSALDAGDLDGAMTPAYWLSIHHRVAGLPEDLQPYVDDMRTAAMAVEAAEDIDTARAAANRISAACDACHVATGVETE